MLDETRVPLASVLAGLFWLVGIKLLVVGVYVEGVGLQSLGLGVIGVAMTLCFRCMLRQSHARERDAFELGRACGDRCDDFERGGGDNLRALPPR